MGRSSEDIVDASPTPKRWVINATVMHPSTRAFHRCRVRVIHEGLVLTRMAGQPEGTIDERTDAQESDPLTVAWRSLRGFSADESFEAPWGPRLQVLEIDTDEGVLTLLAAAADVSLLFAAVGEWSGHWRVARSPLGLVLKGRRRNVPRRVA